MQVILFQGKRSDTGQWVEGAFIPDALESVKGAEVDWGFIRYYDMSSGKMVTVEVERKTVRQFTGETDKHGIKIFESDIVKVAFEKEYAGLKARPSYVGVVEFKNGAFGIYEQGKGTQYFFQHGLIKTVIGNIYDNSDLLRKGDNIS